MENSPKTPILQETGQEALSAKLEKSIIEAITNGQCDYTRLLRIATDLKLPIASDINAKRRELIARLNTRFNEKGLVKLKISEADLKELYAYFPQEDLSERGHYRSPNAGIITLDVAGQYEVRLRISSEPGSNYIDFIDAIGQPTPVVETQSEEEQEIDKTRERINGLVQAVLDTYRKPNHKTTARVNKIVEGLVAAGKNDTWLTAHNAELGIEQPGAPFKSAIGKIQKVGPGFFGYQLKSKKSPDDTHRKTWGYRLISKS